jgi:hypothetical protein
VPSGKYKRSADWRAAQSRSQRYPSQTRKLAQAARRKRERAWIDFYYTCMNEAVEGGWEPEDALVTTIESFRNVADGGYRELQQPFLLKLLRKYAREFGLPEDAADRWLQQLLAEKEQERL